MTRRLSTFRQSDVARAVKAAQAAGLAIGTVEITPDGTIRVVVADTGAIASASPFDQWKVDHARQN
ncbi:hypothetical protein [Pseudorhodobacter ferrugineus]|uniref:hypothetical protein n=1 Tax=Pseudorhodobacter ferrugineus TaxID=77008 RepID=UPI0003B53166|nr:hypothetical protein [Pseudorhodobacter ferrugineus]